MFRSGFCRSWKDSIPHWAQRPCVTLTLTHASTDICVYSKVEKFRSQTVSTTGAVLFQYWLSILCHILPYYWRSTDAVFFDSTGKTMNWDIDSWHSTGILRAQYWLLLLAKYRQRRCANFSNSTGLVVAVYRIQILAINDIEVSSTVGSLLVCYCRNTDYYY